MRYNSVRKTHLLRTLPRNSDSTGIGQTLPLAKAQEKKNPTSSPSFTAMVLSYSDDSKGTLSLAYKVTMTPEEVLRALRKVLEQRTSMFPRESESGCA